MNNILVDCDFDGLQFAQLHMSIPAQWNTNTKWINTRCLPTKTFTPHSLKPYNLLHNTTTHFNRLVQALNYPNPWKERSWGEVIKKHIEKGRTKTASDGVNKQTNWHLTSDFTHHTSWQQVCIHDWVQVWWLALLSSAMILKNIYEPGRQVLCIQWYVWPFILPTLHNVVGEGADCNCADALYMLGLRFRWLVARLRQAPQEVSQ